MKIITDSFREEYFLLTLIRARIWVCLYAFGIGLMFSLKNLKEVLTPFSDPCNKPTSKYDIFKQKIQCLPHLLLRFFHYNNYLSPSACS
jgi:hypothetical protein